MYDLPTIPKRKKVLAGWDLDSIEVEDEVEDEMEAQLFWEDFVYDVKRIMKEMKTKKFFVYGLSLTWRNVGGYTSFETENAETLIRKLAPKNTQYTMLFHPTDKKGIIEVVISHHDKPCGETMYLMSQSRAKKEMIMETYFN